MFLLQFAKNLITNDVMIEAFIIQFNHSFIEVSDYIEKASLVE